MTQYLLIFYLGGCLATWPWVISGEYTLLEALVGIFLWPLVNLMCLINYLKGVLRAY